MDRRDSRRGGPARPSNKAYALMSANPPSSTPITPFPDPPGGSGQEPDPAARPLADPPPPQDMAKPTTSSADDLSLLLAQSAPDPYLSEGVERSDPADAGKPIADIADAELVSSLRSLSSSENELDINFSPSPDALSATTQNAANTMEPAGDLREEDVAPRTSWPLLLVSSYASALTLALGFILWTGRGLSRPDFTTSAEQVAVTNSASPSPVTRQTGVELVPLPEPNITVLGKSTRLGELEVTPRAIARRSVNLLRLQGTAEGERESPPVLVLTVDLANRSRSSTFAPLDRAIVRDPVPAVDQSFIELCGDRRIAMFRLALESEWSIQDQDFPTLKPGESIETILVSDPVAMAELAGTMTWHLKLRTAPYRTDVLGIRFTADQVANESD